MLPVRTILTFVIVLLTAQELAAQQWQYSGNNTYYNTGNAGIGTQSPESNLHIAGSSGSGMIMINALGNTKARFGGTTSPAHPLHISKLTSGSSAIIALSSAYSGTSDSYVGDLGDYGTILSNNRNPSDGTFSKNAISPNQNKAAAISVGGYNTTVNDCNKVKYGTFYFYPPKTNDEFVIIRDKDLQREIDFKTKDTTFWQLKWKNDCEFSLRFIRKSGPISDEEKAFYNAHVSVVQIAKVSKQYYVFNGGLDSIESRNPLSDTIWFKPRIK